MSDLRKITALLLLVAVNSKLSLCHSDASSYGAQPTSSSYAQPASPSYSSAPVVAQPTSSYSQPPATSSYAQQPAAASSYSQQPATAAASSSYGGTVQSQPTSSYGQPTGGSSYGTPQVPQVQDTVVLGLNVGAPNIPVPDNYVPLFHLYNPIVPLAPKVVFDDPWIDFNPGEPADVPDTADQLFDFEVDEPYLFETDGFISNPLAQGQTRYFLADSGYNGGLSRGGATAAPGATLSSGIGPGFAPSIPPSSGGTYGQNAGGASSYGQNTASASSSYGASTVAAAPAAPSSSYGQQQPVASASTYARANDPASSLSAILKSLPASKAASSAFTGADIPGRATFQTVSQQQPARQQQFQQLQTLNRVQRQLFPVQHQQPQQQQQQQQNAFPDTVEDLNQPLEHPAKQQLASLSALELQQAQRPEVAVEAVQIVTPPPALMLRPTAAPVRTVFHPLYAARQRALLVAQQRRRQQEEQSESQPIVINISNSPQAMQQLQQVAAAPNVTIKISTPTFEDETPVIHPLFRKVGGPTVESLMLDQFSTQSKVKETPAFIQVVQESSSSLKRPATIAVFPTAGVNFSSSATNPTLVLNSPAAIAEAMKLHPALRDQFRQASTSQVQPIAPQANESKQANVIVLEKQVVQLASPTAVDKSVNATLESTLTKLSGMLDSALAPIGFNLTAIETRSNL